MKKLRWLFCIFLLVGCSEKKKVDFEEMQDLAPKGCSVQKLNDCSGLELDRCQIKRESCDSKKKQDIDLGDIK